MNITSLLQGGLDRALRAFTWDGGQKQGNHSLQFSDLEHLRVFDKLFAPLFDRTSRWCRSQCCECTLWQSWSPQWWRSWWRPEWLSYKNEFPQCQETSWLLIGMWKPIFVEWRKYWKYQVETIWFKNGSVSHGFTWLHMVSQHSSVSSGKTSLQHTARPTRSIMFFPSSCINTELHKNHPSFNLKNMELMRNSPKVSNANLPGGWATPMKKMKVVWDCQGWTCNMFETTKQVIIGYTPIQSPLYPHAIPKKYSHSTPMNYSH